MAKPHQRGDGLLASGDGTYHRETKKRSLNDGLRKGEAMYTNIAVLSHQGMT